MSISSLPTPAFLIEANVAEQNANMMLHRAKTLGVHLRVNVKTHKNLELASLQLLGHWGTPTTEEKMKFRIGTSTISECRHFLAAGFGDVLLCVPLAGAPKVALARSLMLQYPNQFSVLLDSIEAVEALSADVSWKAFIKVDSGYGRAGHKGGALTSVVSAVQKASNITLRGLYTHAGHSYALQKDVSLAQRSVCEAEAIFEEFKSNSLSNECEISIGATPTASSKEEDSGAVAESYKQCRITELHPGNYLFFDRMQNQIGSCEMSQIAVSVLATVIGVYPERGSALIDAGSRALGKDTLENPTDSPWGVLKNLEMLKLTSISQEVGILKGDGVEMLKVGQQVRVVPNHSCITATNFDEYYLVKGDDTIFKKLVPLARGWN